MASSAADRSVGSGGELGLPGSATGSGGDEGDVEGGGVDSCSGEGGDASGRPTRAEVQHVIGSQVWRDLQPVFDRWGFAAQAPQLQGQQSLQESPVSDQSVLRRVRKENVRLTKWMRMVGGSKRAISRC